jgi:two-component system sensor histidine kinase KdpD
MAVPAQDRRPFPRRRHRVFLGYAVGVGKTFAMLGEGAERLRAGEDVVIGWLEPHGRSDIIGLAASFSRVQALAIPYRGAAFCELDVDAVIARDPAWVLVDELAHAIVPGTRHSQRWQAVDEILDAGIGVISTLNVQHLESLGGLVAQVTGSRAEETVPDRMVDEADEIVLVDMAPEALLARVKRGEVYAAGDVGLALTHFFRMSTLVVLREQARLVASRRDPHAT